MLFRHSGIYILAKLIPGLMAFAALSLYTHLLTPSEYGVYTLIFTGTVFIHNVVFNWLSSGTLRYWSNQEYSDSQFINTLSTSLLRISSVVLVFALIAAAFFWDKTESLWVIASFSLLIALALFTITQNLFSAKIEPASYAFLTIVYSICSLTLGGLFSYMGYGATGVIFGIALGTSIPALFVFKRLWLPYKKADFNKGLFKRLLTYGIPLAAAALVEEITKVSDRFMLAGIQGKDQAGLYAVGYDLSGNSILMIMSAINIAAYPVIIKLLDNEGVKAATDYFRHYVILLLGVSIPAVIGLNLVGPNLVHLLIDLDYQESVIFLLPWITSAIFLLGLQVFYFDLAFQLGHKTIASVKIAVAIAIINIGLNFWLIPIMGIHGAAIATISSFAVGSLLSAYFGRKYFSLPFPAIETFKIVIATLVMCLCLYWLRDKNGWGWLLLQLSIGAASYFVMMLLFNILDIRSMIKDRLAR
ncbi:oligosaccharide flippase family protein [Cocleimonas sp. KMM 6892]|uniref:oligosaccharide flippase family protein n=1 Tax=unclassified Cocleimonas TaxID=2639732 RepID=UPI002DBBE419|nr:MULTISPECIES: oligosaccharide flippase family protein [unclassified Cocleimonas]MEB8431769.1 oligosaccharide flippase family protein [Cocleimonas sp. KMM 6892]MEC4715145.1 oligosaccharide flippase family protein [Cocleimonas sp. KMM 6895]MEC4744041.1 oligosaccharide flippase family protein [Cocleimonas sp. KMM 6896]